MTTSITFDSVILLADGDPNSLVCLDIGYGVNLVDKTWLVRKLFSQNIITMPVPLNVRGIGASKHKANMFPLTALYFLGLDRKGSKVYICIKCEPHVVKGLKVNMLIGNDVFCTKGFLINLTNTFTHILKYGVNINITAKSHSQFFRRNILANTTIIVLPKSKALILFKQISLLDLHDFLFYPYL